MSGNLRRKNSLKSGQPIHLFIKPITIYYRQKLKTGKIILKLFTIPSLLVPHQF